LIVIVPPEIYTAPPGPPLEVVLLVKVELVIVVGVALLKIAAPPVPLTPGAVFTLFVKVQLVTVSVTLLPVIAPPELFVFALNIESVTVRLPAFEIAPVTAIVNVMPLIDTVSPELMANMRTRLFPLIVSKLAPGPVIVKESPVAGLIVTTLARVIVRGVLKNASNTIVSEPAALFESITAWRKLPAPLSFVFVTVKVAAVAFRADTARIRTDRANIRLKKFVADDMVYSFGRVNFLPVYFYKRKSCRNSAKKILN